MTKSSTDMKRVALIGTGNIAAVHAEALKQCEGVQLEAVMDVVAASARNFADKHRIPVSYGSLAELLETRPDVIHILTPPPTHFTIASEVLARGIPVFLEKPMAETAGECGDLQSLARENSARIRVNQNYVFAPAHQKLRRALDQNRIGPVRSISCTYAMPLRQLGARQFGHWMFDSPRNLLLEQAVHPISLIDDLGGPAKLETVWHAAPREFAPGISLITEWMATLTAGNVPVQLHLKLGADYPDWRVSVMGDDGRIEADYLRDTATIRQAGAYIDFAENLRTNMADSLSLTAQGVAAAAKYLAAQAGALGRSDSFFLSIRNSIRQFYGDLGVSSENLNGEQGARVVALCEEIAGKSATATGSKPTQAPSVKKGTPGTLLLGGTGFIGARLVNQLLQAGENVRVVARNINNLPTDFQDTRVELIKGSISDGETLATAMQGVNAVVNLAHGGGGNSWDEVRAAMVGGAELVAEAASAAEVKKFIHVGSIAALYLGDPDTTIRHDTSVDPLKEERADYSRAKAEADLALLALHQTKDLPVSIFRPGVVLGQGTSPFHSGIGFYNRDRVCLGWNRGINPLPLVLVQDVATALCQAVLEVQSEHLSGKCFNLVGDVRMNARDYTQELAHATSRPLVYRPQFLWQQQAGEVSKWVIKKVGGREVAFPSMRDLKSRGLVSPFDTTVEKKVLNWQPVADRDTFIEQAIRIHGTK